MCGCQPEPRGPGDVGGAGGGLDPRHAFDISPGGADRACQASELGVGDPGRVAHDQERTLLVACQVALEVELEQVGPDNSHSYAARVIADWQGAGGFILRFLTLEGLLLVRRAGPHASPMLFTTPTHSTPHLPPPL